VLIPLLVGWFLCTSWYEARVANDSLPLGKTMRVRKKKLAYW
jgi:hypothetical protein